MRVYENQKANANVKDYDMCVCVCVTLAFRIIGHKTQNKLNEINKENQSKEARGFVTLNNIFTFWLYDTTRLFELNQIPPPPISPCSFSLLLSHSLLMAPGHIALKSRMVWKSKRGKIGSHATYQKAKTARKKK